MERPSQRAIDFVAKAKRDQEELTNMFVEFFAELEKKRQQEREQERAMLGSEFHIKRIIKVCADIWGYGVKDIMGIGRSGDLPIARHAAMWMARVRLYNGVKGTGSFPWIAKHFNKKDHTSIIYAYHKMEELIMKSEDIRRKVNLAMLELDEIENKPSTLNYWGG